jgi:tetratricopeptide (TPR) repeat protein
LAYVLERDFRAGLILYLQYFEQIKSYHLFDLNDMLWGEVAALLGNDRQAYELTLEQADWLFEIGRPADAAFWFDQLIGSRFTDVRDPRSHTRARIRLGHCHLQLGEADQAGEIWEEALEKAKAAENSDELSSFSYNLGHVRHQQGQWEDALNLYRNAIQYARNSQDKETRDIMGEALFVMARLRARQADLEQALQELRTGLQITERLHSGKIRHAQALIYAGDVHRYLGDPLTAQGYYGHSWQLLRDMDGWFNWKTLVLAGLGAAYNLSGKTRRENGEDFESDINDQQKSLEYFQQCLQMAREYDTESRLHQVFDRMGDLYLELNILGTRDFDNSLEEKVKGLISQASALSLLEERTWRFRLREPEQTFEMLDLLGKAQRLFDLALLQADKFGEHHFMFDSLTQAASVAQQRGREGDLVYYATLASTLRGLDDPQQETLFLSYLDLLGAHNTFKVNPQAASEQYASTALDVVAGGVFGRYLMQQQLATIQNNLLSLPKDEANYLCDILFKRWGGSTFLSSFIQGVRDQLLFFD